MRPTDVRPFVKTGNTIALSPTTGSVNSALAGNIKNPEMPGTIRVYNFGPDIAFFRQSATASPTAATTDIPIAPGNTETFELQADTVAIAAICPTSSATVYVTPGQGI